MPRLRNPRRAWCRAVAVVALAAGLPFGLSAPAGATPGAPTPAPSGTATAAAGRATFGIVPATVGRGVGRPYFSYAMGVGGSYADKVVVVNYGRSALDLSVFAADLGNGADGALAVGLASAPRRDAGAWVHLARPTVDVHVPPSGASGPGDVTLPFRIAVPGEAAPGDHAAAIVASLSTLGRNAKGQNVRLDQRIATRIYLRVAGPLRPSLAVENLTATYHGAIAPLGHGRLDVRYTVRNTGNVRLGARQRLSVSGWFGATGSVRSLADVPLLLPGSSVVIRTTVPDVSPEVRVHAKVVLFPLKLSTDANPAGGQVSAATSTWAVPWSLVGLVLIVLLAVVAFLLWRRRPSRRGPSGPSGPARHARPKVGALS